jgi:hypothetical protein
MAEEGKKLPKKSPREKPKEKPKKKKLPKKEAIEVPIPVEERTAVKRRLKTVKAGPPSEPASLAHLGAIGEIMKDIFHYRGESVSVNKLIDRHRPLDPLTENLLLGRGNCYLDCEYRDYIPLNEDQFELECLARRDPKNPRQTLTLEPYDVAIAGTCDVRNSRLLRRKQLEDFHNCTRDCLHRERRPTLKELKGKDREKDKQKDKQKNRAAAEDEVYMFCASYKGIISAKDERDPEETGFVPAKDGRKYCGRYEWEGSGRIL